MVSCHLNGPQHLTFVAVIFLSLLAFPAWAQNDATVAATPTSTPSATAPKRGASFLPLDDTSATSDDAPVSLLAPITPDTPASGAVPAATQTVTVTPSAAPQPFAAPPVIVPPTTIPAAAVSTAGTPAVTAPPVATVPAAAPVVLAPAAPAPITTPPAILPTARAPAIIPPATATPVTIPAAAAAMTKPPVAAVAPVMLAPAAAQPATVTVPVTPAAPNSSITPVESGKLADINPESIGLLASSDSGLGAAMWKDTSRALVEKLLPSLNVPTSSATLNNLAGRFLATTANAPEGPAGTHQSLVAMRIERLVALGQVADAWKLALLGKPDQVDDITLRQTAEAALATPLADDVCSRMTDLVKTHTAVEWQRLAFVCLARAKDLKSAQITLDILHAQNVKDDVFYALAEKNIIAGKKQLPRQLTPMKPLYLALLMLVDEPLRDEIYVHVDAGMIPAILKEKSLQDKSKLELADRSAARGLLDAPALIEQYRSIVFLPEVLAGALNSHETGARQRTLMVQAATADKNPANDIVYATKYMQSGPINSIEGAVGDVLGTIVADIEPSGDFNAVADQLLLMHILAGEPQKALAWLKQAQTAAIGMPGVAAGLQNIWPLIVLSGLESDKNYSRDFGLWLDATLKTPAPKVVDAATPDAPPAVDTKPVSDDERSVRRHVASLLLLLDADGFAVPDNVWAKVTDAPEFAKRMGPDAFIIERLMSAGSHNRRGEAVMDALVAANGANDLPLATALPIIRALRAVGLTADAANLARETADNFVLNNDNTP